MDAFPHIEFAMSDFVGGIILCNAEDPRGPTIGWGLKPYLGHMQGSMH